MLCHARSDLCPNDSEDSPHAYLLATQTAALPLARENLVTAMLHDPAVLRFALALLPAALRADAAHRTLVAFHTAVIVQYLSRAADAAARTGMDEGVLAAIVAALLAPLELAPDAGGASGVRRDAAVGHTFLLFRTHVDDVCVSSRLTRPLLRSHGRLHSRPRRCLHSSSASRLRRAHSVCPRDKLCARSSHS
jgi:hypothetical protein